MFPGTYQLYGSKRSYFTQKLENILRYQALPYVLIEKMPHDGSDIERRTGSGAIPALVTPEDWPLADSTPIARMLNERYPHKPIIPASPVQRIGVLLLEDWLDEWFMRVAMYTRWNFPESVDALIGSGVSMRVLGKAWHEVTAEEHQRIRPEVDAGLERIATFRERMTTEVAEAYGTTLEQGADIPIWWGEFLDDMAAHLQHHPFLLGERPCVADFVISGGYAAHFGNDTWPRSFTLERQPRILDYVDACWTARADEQQWLADDRLPTTWGPFWTAMQEGYLPYLLANRAALGAGEKMVEMDFGFGSVATPVRVYQELSRTDIGDEIYRLSPHDWERVRAAIPDGVLDAYLAPPLERIPGLAGNKDTFPQPEGIGQLDA
ncbi:MAG: glutathione S-transferase family protein [Pseudomonadota bacterium]